MSRGGATHFRNGHNGMLRDHYSKKKLRGLSISVDIDILVGNKQTDLIRTHADSEHSIASEVQHLCGKTRKKITTAVPYTV